MDLKHTTTTTTSVAAADSPDTDGETPLQSQLIQPFSTFPNGKTHHHYQPPHTVAVYKECLKNHAATIGSHALDGCGEFMPSPATPTSLKCAACGCHRNFHRREPVTGKSINYAYAPHVLLSLDQTHLVATPGTPAAIRIENPIGRKRFRTKFSQDQKEKMHQFAEKVGWKMQRCDDKSVTDFCNGIGIRRGIFKVWMHNNKNTFGKKDNEKLTQFPSPITVAAAAAADGGVVSSEYSREEDHVNVDGNDRNSNSSDQEINDGGGGGGGGGCGGAVHLHASTNGSSSSC